MSRILPFHSLGGMQVVAWDLARQFVKEGMAATCLTTRIPGRPPYQNIDGVDVVALQQAQPERYGAGWWRGSKRYFQQHLARPGTGVLSVSAAAYGLLSLRHELRDTPFILQAHGTSRNEIISKWRRRTPRALAGSIHNMIWLARDLVAYRHFDQVVAVGDTVHQDFGRWPLKRWVPAGKVTTIRNGVDTAVYLPSMERRVAMRKDLGLDAEPTIISVSRLHHQKGIDLGLLGLARVASVLPTVRYLVVGAGQERTRLQHLAQELGLQKNVHFIGEVDRTRIPDYLRAADALLFTTTHTEGLPLNVLEALAVGLPCVISAHLQHVASISPACITVRPRDADDVANGIRRALSSSLAGTDLLPSAYSLSFCAQQYMEAFERAAHV